MRKREPASVSAREDDTEALSVVRPFIMDDGALAGGVEVRVEARGRRRRHVSRSGRIICLALGSAGPAALCMENIYERRRES
jgi:hypothetical protein